MFSFEGWPFIGFLEAVIRVGGSDPWWRELPPFKDARTPWQGGQPGGCFAGFHRLGGSSLQEPPQIGRQHVGPLLALVPTLRKATEADPFQLFRDRRVDRPG